MANQPTFGILVPSPIRVNDFDDNYPSAFAIDIKGGHHMFATITERNAITEGRREWGMLCTVYNNITDTVSPDASKNGTYQLVRGASNTTITDNNNWRIFSGGPATLQTGEWLTSVSSIRDTPPGVTPSSGTRFLIATPSFTGFVSYPNHIAEYDNSANSGFGGYVFTAPTDGSTVRVDDSKNTIFKFVGSWTSGGYWSKEYLTQVRYIQPVTSDGSTYSFTTSNTLVSLDAYSYSVYYANFGVTNSGGSTLQIDGLGYYPLKKRGTFSIVDLSSGDLIPNVSYHLSWNNNNFLVHNIAGPSVVAGGSVSNVIGPAEDGTYSDGLFTDFNPEFPIGFAVDRINEVLKGLVPSPAKDLQSWSLAGPSFVNGRVSFDVGNANALGLSAVPGLLRGGDFNVSGYRKGITSLVNQPNNLSGNVYTDISGVLNSGVAADSNGAYPAESFGNGLTGSIVMRLNGVTVSDVSLANPSAINTTGGLNGGLNLTAATSSKFPSGIGFEFFWHRKGTYLVKRDAPLLKDGYNFVQISHVLPTSTINLPAYEWVADGSTNLTLYTSNNVNSISGANEKWLSGIRYWTTLSLNYQVTLTNHVKNTYRASGAITSTNFIDTVSNNPVNNKKTVTSTPVMIIPAAKDISTTLGSVPNNPNSTETVTFNYTLSPNVRRLNESISFNTTVERTVQGRNTGGVTQVDGFVLDNYPETSSISAETFVSEQNRIRNGTSRWDPTTDTTTNMVSLTWDKTQSLNSSALYRNALQFMNGSLIYPNFDYSSAGGSTTKNPNFGAGNAVVYTDCDTTTTGFTETGGVGSANRTFTRIFRVDITKAWSTLEFTITYENTNFVAYNQTLDTNKVWIEIKLPRDPAKAAPPPTVVPQLVGQAITGWLDMTRSFVGSENRQNGAGVLSGNRPTATSGTNVAWRVNFGPGINTDYSSGYVLFRVTASPNWTGSITSVSVAGVP